MVNGNGVACRGSVRTEAAGEAVVLLAARGLYWPRASTLLVADLHLGKSETFQGMGVPIPDGVLEHDLTRLSAMLKETGASRLVVLGDLIHSGPGLTERVVARVAAWRRQQGVRFELVPGNHDRHVAAMPRDWEVGVLEPVVRDGPFVLCHDPAACGEEYRLSGHIHPLVRLADAGGSMRLPCFVLGASGAVLPAFGAFTGGRAVRWMPGERVFAVAGPEVVSLGCGSSDNAGLAIM